MWDLGPIHSLSARLGELSMFSSCSHSALGVAAVEVSTKRPDVLRQPPSDMVALTLAEMLVLNWTLRGVCDHGRCGLAVKVSLPTLIRVYGPHKVWWGECTSCPREGCEGRIAYAAQSIRGGTWKSLKAPPSELAVQRWKNARGDFGWQGPR